MESKKALAILALSLSINAAALPQKDLPFVAVSAPRIALDSPSQAESLQKRQLPGVSLLLPAATSSKPAVAISIAALSVVPTPSALPGVLGSVPILGSVPVLGSALGGGVSTPLGASSPVGAVATAVGGVTASSSPIGAGVIGGVVTTAAGAVPTPSATSGLAPGALSPYPVSNGIPGTDPVGAFSISVIATLLSLLKKDPLSLFAPSLPIPSLVKRDLPHLHRAGIPELAKRQVSGLTSLSSGIPGVGVGGLPGSGVPGIPPDLAFLVGSIAKNIAVPGGTGLGAITGNILSVLNGVVPNFLFQLPVVQDSVPTFGVLQLLASINPTKFGQLGSLNSLPALSIAAAGLPAGDLAFLKTLPISSDPTNLVTTIMSFSDNVLTLPGNVANLKAAVAALSLKSLGLAVPGL